REGGVDGERVDRRVGQVAADIGPALAGVCRLEDVAGLVWSGRVEPVVSEVGDAVVAAVDRDPRDRAGGQRVLVPRALAVEVEAGPRRVVADHGVGAEEDEAVVGARVDAGPTADAEERAVDEAGAEAAAAAVVGLVDDHLPAVA